MTWIHFSVSPNSSKHKLLAPPPEWVQVKHNGTVLVDAEKADPATLAEIIGYPVQYVKEALNTYQKGSHPYYSEVNAVLPKAMPTLYAFFHVDPSSPYSKGDKTLPKGIEYSSKTDFGVFTVRVNVDEADPAILAEVVGYSAKYVEHSLEIVKKYALAQKYGVADVQGSTVIGPPSILKEAKETHWSSHSVKVSSHVLSLYPVPDFVVQSNLPEWASVTADYGPGQWVVNVDMNHATAVVLAQIAGWTVHKAKSVIEEFDQAKKVQYQSLVEHIEPTKDHGDQTQETVKDAEEGLGLTPQVEIVKKKIEEAQVEIVKKKIEEAQDKVTNNHLHIKTPPPLPEWAVPDPMKPWMVKIDLSQATAEGLAEITGWSVQYAQQRLNYFLSHPGLTPLVGIGDSYLKKDLHVSKGTHTGYASGGVVGGAGAGGGVTVHKNGPSSFVVAGGGGGGGIGVGANAQGSTLPHNVPTEAGVYTLKSLNKIVSSTNLPSWLMTTQDPNVVLVDVVQANPHELASLTGWSVSVVQSFLAHAKTEFFKKMAEKDAQYQKLLEAVAPGKIEEEAQAKPMMKGYALGHVYVDEVGTYPWATGKIAEMSFTKGDEVEFKADDTALADFIKNKHGLTLPTNQSFTMDIPITAISPETANLLFGNGPKPPQDDEDEEVTGPDPVDALSEATGSSVTLSDKAKASLSPDRQRIAQRALEVVQCNCKPMKGTNWHVSSDCPVHGSKENVTIAVVNAVLDYLGVIP